MIAPIPCAMINIDILPFNERAATFQDACIKALDTTNTNAKLLFDRNIIPSIVLLVIYICNTEYENKYIILFCIAH